MPEAKVEATLASGKVIRKEFYPHRDEIRELRFRHKKTRITVRVDAQEVEWNGKVVKAEGPLCFFRRVRQEFTVDEGAGERYVTYFVGLGTPNSPGPNDFVLQVPE